MILQALAGYYDRIRNDPENPIAGFGFQSQEIPFVIVLERDGTLAGLDDTRTGDGKKKKARVFIVPKGMIRTLAISPNLLWDTPAYIVGRPKPDKKKDPAEQLERAREQQARFREHIRRTFPENDFDDGITAVLRFLETGDFQALFARPEWPEIEETAPFLSFRLAGDEKLVCQRPAVEAAIRRSAMAEMGESSICLITGEYDQAQRLHTAIKGVWGAQSSGAGIVSFNLAAFNSYGKEQGYNAPVGRNAEFAYTTALNTLLGKGSRQRMQVGDASTVFWAAKENALEGSMAALFGAGARENSEQDNAAVRALYSSYLSGSMPLLEDNTSFFVLGLSPNAARLVVRFWYTDTVGETTRHIFQHFDDCRLVHSPKERDYLPLFMLLSCTALEEKSENVPANLGGDMAMAILSGRPYPQTALSAVVRRIRAERRVTYARAALIKAILVRARRFHQNTEKEVEMSIDKTNRNAGYLLGRLFAVLERAQEIANPHINATIRDRYYGGASSTPAAVFPLLLKLKNHHLAKLENRGTARYLESILTDVMGGMDDFPVHLSLHDQGRFAIGYYHQRQDFYTSKSAQQDEQPNE